MVFVIGEDIGIRFDSCGLPVTAISVRSDPVMRPAVLINPFPFRPFPRVCFIWPNEVEPVPVHSSRIAQWNCLSCQEEIKRLHLIPIWFFPVEIFQSLHHSRTADRHAT